MTCWAKQYSKLFSPRGRATPAGAGTKQAKALPRAWNLHTQTKGAPNSVTEINNVMDPNIYLNAIVSSRLAQRDQKLKLQAIPEPEFKPFDLAYLPWDISDALAALNGSRAIPTCVAWSPRALFLKEISE